MKKKCLLMVAFLALFFLICSSIQAETFGVKKKRLKPHEYGTVLISNYSDGHGIKPVVFPHWLHRAKYSCRLCHVDIGFAMEAKETEITESDIRNGLYCGACHNGKESFAPEEEQPGGVIVSNCVRCHSYGESNKLEEQFYAFRKQMPKDRFGNTIDWLKAEDQGLITVKDYLAGISAKVAKFKAPPDFKLTAEEPNMPDITLSHQKHAVWNGCELCHPEIFPIKKRVQPYSMQDIFEGKYCGVCHDKVAFPNIDCRRCHVRQVF